jgi:multiple sugar transport system permease protein
VKGRHTVRRWLPTVGATLVVGLFLIPVLWTIETSLKTRIDAWTMPPRWIFTPSLANYRSVLFEHGFIGYLKNSLIVAIGATAIALCLGSLAAYGLERNRFRGKQALFFVFLFAYMVPEMAIALPAYLLAVRLNAIDTYWVLIAMHATFATAFATWMLRGFFADVPKEIEECALADGCTRLGAFFRIALPLAAPGLVATAVFCLIFSWNDFPYALVLSTLRVETLPVAVGQLKTPAGTAWGEIMAVTVIAFTPTVIFAFVVQKWLVRGLSFGAVK